MKLRGLANRPRMTITKSILQTKKEGALCGAGHKTASDVTEGVQLKVHFFAVFTASPNTHESCLVKVIYGQGRNSHVPCEINWSGRSTLTL